MPDVAGAPRAARPRARGDGERRRAAGALWSRMATQLGDGTRNHEARGAGRSAPPPRRRPEDGSARSAGDPPAAPRRRARPWSPRRGVRPIARPRYAPTAPPPRARPRGSPRGAPDTRGPRHASPPPDRATSHCRRETARAPRLRELGELMDEEALPGPRQPGGRRPPAPARQASQPRV